MTRLLGSALAASGLLSIFTARPPEKADLASSMGELLPDSGGARIIGERVLAMDPHAAQRARLLGRALRSRPDTAARRAYLWSRRCRDLRREDIVMVDGWVMAATEADLCVLSRLSTQRGA